MSICIDSNTLHLQNAVYRNSNDNQSNIDNVKKNDPIVNETGVEVCISDKTAVTNEKTAGITAKPE